MTVYVIGVSIVFCLVTPLSWLHGELGAVRNWQTVFNPVLAFVIAWNGLYRGESVSLPVAVKRFFALSIFVFCLSVQLGRFFNFEVNGVDFSIFDWMLFNSNHGRWGYSPIYDVNHFGVHATYVLLPLMLLHRLFEGPLLLCMVTVLAVGGAAYPLWRLGRHAGLHEGLCVLLVLAYLTNPVTSILLDGGFRPEVFFPLFGLLFVDGWVERRPALWVPSLIAFLAIKEDAAFYVAAFAVGVWLFERERWKPAAAMLVGAIALFIFNVKYFQPLMLRGSAFAVPSYVSFWGQYGQTLPEILGNMARSPLRLARDILTSGWSRMFGAALFLPLLGRLAVPPMLPTIFLLGSASYPVMHEYRMYYPVTLLPFFFLGLVESWRVLGRSSRWSAWREALLVVALLLFPIVGRGYARFTRPPMEVHEALSSVRARLARETGPICVQTVIYPHLPYQLSMRPLFNDCWGHPEWPMLINLRLNTSPYERYALEAWVAEARRDGRVEELGGGFLLILKPDDSSRRHPGSG
ncbi:DUF2079 domain-containing protein [Pyxidicoccus parkwayensis]|uniref:DUF2079 domain-containing protein n=1 Tax=Pyxidicoccus parkwayensis TaxID=2813578 RepID=A0ABX7NV50_9BACT|nr:DUF2079 domain-containing protein [Pyxidicoccus parkwaysis]QSQ22281.1 DUF2079 domain-containing protein [Pyxidicoccus parkwaysis]